MPLLVFEMGAHLSDTIHGALHAWIGLEAVRVLSFLLATFVLFGRESPSRLARAGPPCGAARPT